MSYQPDQPWPSDPMHQPWGGPTGPKPPVIPFRPLTLGDLFDGTFAAIRSNPQVMFTISLGVMAIVGVLSGIVTALIPEQDFTGEIVMGDDIDFYMEGVTAMPGLLGGSVQGFVGILTAAASLLITGMLVLSVTNAVVGVNLDLKATWEELKPHFWRLVGTALLVWVILGVATFVAIFVPIIIGTAMLFGFSNNAVGPLILALVLVGLIGIAAVVWLSVRLYFATIVTVVEGASPTAALGRSWTLTKGAFWRTFGRLLLMGIIVSIVVGLVGGALSIAISFAGNVMPWAITVFLLALVSNLVAALAMPFSASFTSLMYVDERIRKENLGPALQAALDAGAAGPQPSAS